MENSLFGMPHLIILPLVKIPETLLFNSIDAYVLTVKTSWTLGPCHIVRRIVRPLEGHSGMVTGFVSGQLHGNPILVRPVRFALELRVSDRNVDQQTAGNFVRLPVLVIFAAVSHWVERETGIAIEIAKRREASCLVAIFFCTMVEEVADKLISMSIVLY